MKKICSLLLVMAMLLTLFSACAPAAPAAPAAAPAAPAEQAAAPAAAPAAPAAPAAEPAAAPAAAAEENVEIFFLGAQYSDLTEPFLKQVVADFMAANPNVNIKMEIVGWDNIDARIAALVGAGQAPDIYNGGSAAEYVPDGLLYKVEDVISPELKADFFVPFWENNIDPNDGLVYAIPYLASVRALYYNQKLFDQAGITKAPATWKEVEEVCAKIKEFYNGDVYAWGLDATTTEGQTMIAYYGWNNGGGFLDDAGNWALNSAANVEAYEWVKGLYEKGYTNENPTLENRDDQQKLVAADKMAMLLTACFFPALYPDVELGIAPIPYNDATQSASSSLGVQDGVLFFNESAKQTTDSPAKMEAMSKFMDFFYEAARYTDFMVQEGLLPATVSGAERLAEIAPEQAAYIEVLGGCKFYPRSRPEYRTAQTGVISAAQQMLEGVATAQEGLDAVQADVLAEIG